MWEHPHHAVPGRARPIEPWSAETGASRGSSRAGLPAPVPLSGAMEPVCARSGGQDWYLSPLPLTGTTAEAMDAWITTGVRQGEAGELERIWRTNDRGHKVLAAEGYEIARTCGAPDGDVEWSERVLVVRSPMHATQQAAGLDKRLHYAETQLTALTPPRGRGKRQITDEATLVEAIAHV